VLVARGRPTRGGAGDPAPGAPGAGRRAPGGGAESAPTSASRCSGGTAPMACLNDSWTDYMPLLSAVIQPFYNSSPHHQPSRTRAGRRGSCSPSPSSTAVPATGCSGERSAAYEESKSGARGIAAAGPLRRAHGRSTPSQRADESVRSAPAGGAAGPGSAGDDHARIPRGAPPTIWRWWMRSAGRATPRWPRWWRRTGPGRRASTCCPQGGRFSVGVGWRDERLNTACLDLVLRHAPASRGLPRCTA